MTPEEEKAYKKAYLDEMKAIEKEIKAEEKEAAQEKAKAAKEAAEREKKLLAERERQVRAMDAAQRLFAGGLMGLKDLPGMILRNLMSGRSAVLGLERKPPPGQQGGGATGTAGAVRGGAAAGIAAGAVLGLGQLFAKVLGDGLRALTNAPTSGMSLFNKAMGLFVATLAPVLLPATFAAAVALLSISDVASDLIPAMTGLASVTMELAIPAIRALAGAAQWVVSRLALGLSAAGVAARGPAAGGAAAFGAIGGGKKGEGADEVDQAVKDLMAEFRSGLMSTPVGTGGPASAFTRAQTAALGMTPVQRRTIDLLSKAVDLLEKANRDKGKGEPATTNERKRGM